MLPRLMAPIWAVMIDAVAVERAGEEVSEPAPRSQSFSDVALIWLSRPLQPPREQIMQQVEQGGGVGLVFGAWRVIGNRQRRLHMGP